jgi:hypothetical protein
VPHSSSAAGAAPHETLCAALLHTIANADLILVERLMKPHSLWKWCSAIIALACGALTYLSLSTAATAQQPITSGFNYSQDFNGLSTFVSALPANWRMDKQATVRTVGTWATAGTTLDWLGGDSMSTSATQGLYNYGAGPAGSAVDRAAGWLSSSAGTQSGNLYLYLQNNSATHSLGSLQMAYDVEKYRNGTDAGGYRVQLQYSYDGSLWFSAGAGFLTSFAADGNNNGYASAPGSTVAVNGALTFVSPVAPSANLYLAWNYSVSSAGSTTNAQGLGIDNVQISNPLQPSAVAVTAMSAANNAASIPIIFLVGLVLTISGAIILRRRSRAA